MKKRTGFIDSRRLKFGAETALKDAPALFLPGSGAYGIEEHFIGVPPIAAAASLGLKSGSWLFREQNDGVVDQGDGAGGIATMACGGANEDACQIILGGTAAMGAFLPAAGKDIWFECRLRSTNLGTNQINLFAGLWRPAAAIILPNAGGAVVQQNILGFIIQDGGAGFYAFIGDKAGVQTITDSTIALDTNYHTFGFYLSGVTTCIVYIDGVVHAIAPVLATRLPLVGLMPCLCIKAGSAAAEIMTVDYIMCAQLS